ncbi:MAG: toxin-antitoxin system YwqK family antitoxin [Bacteriovoracia bacterium]
MSNFRTEVTLIEKSGRTLSKRTEYYESGQVARTGTYGNAQGQWAWNVPMGVITTYYEDGTLESQVNYNDNGSLDGESLYYNKKGELSKKLTYQKDKLIKEEIFNKPADERVRIT